MFRTIVVSTDGSPAGKGNVRWAAELAWIFGARLHVVCSPSTDTCGERLDDLLVEVAATARELGVAAEMHGRIGDPASELLSVATEHGADLVVVAREEVAATAAVSCSVLVVGS